MRLYAYILYAYIYGKIEMKKNSWKKISHFGANGESIGLLLWQAASNWRRQIETALKPLDLTHTQFILLTSIHELTYDGTDVTQGELARHANLDNTMTSQMLRALEQKGLIERRMRPGDDRSKFPHLTPEGQDLVAQATPVVEEVDGIFFDHLKSDTKKCVDILEKLTNSTL